MYTENLKKSINAEDMKQFNKMNEKLEKDEKEKKILEANEKFLSLSLACLKFIPAIIAIVRFQVIKSTIYRATNGECVDADDKRTQETFDDLDAEMTG
jgi:hypothetical protein